MTEKNIIEDVKMKKTIVSLFLAVVLLMTCVVSATAETPASGAPDVTGEQQPMQTSVGEQATAGELMAAAGALEVREGNTQATAGVFTEYATSGNIHENNVSDGGFGIFIASSVVPQSVIEYVQDQFSSFTLDDMIYLGFTFEEACGLRMAPGYKGEMIDSNNTAYYFPFLYIGKIVALMTVWPENNSFNYTFGKDRVADALNAISTTVQNPAEIYLSEDAVYSRDDINGINVLYVLPEANADLIAQQKNDAIRSRITARSSTSKVIIEISEETTYSNTITFRTPRLMGKHRTALPYVENSADYPGTGGVCWASCTGALIEYSNYGSNSSPQDALEMRNTVLEDQYNATGSYSGGISTCKKYLSEYAGVECKATGTKLSWEEVKKEVNNKDFPFYSRWTTSNETTGHAMVVCGYGYDENDSGNLGKYVVFIMDPNKENRQMHKFSSSYMINSKQYKWTNSLIKN